VQRNLMEQARLGRSDLYSSRIALGTWQLSADWGDTDERAVTAAIHQARELGINFFDTAQAYGFGASERLLRLALRGELRHRREDVVIATRGACGPSRRG
jgi:aryl-alcohol dehydrogenase-like predicted oxidoreductase